MAGGIESGRLKERVRLLRPVYTKDDFGQETVQWEDTGTYFAEVVGSGGGTSLSVSRTSITYNHTVKIRNSSRLAGITAEWRVEWKTRIFEIASVIEQDSVLTLDCQDEFPASQPGPV
jgi:SPP1 family predicted phage head-tail adaptor